MSTSSSHAAPKPTSAEKRELLRQAALANLGRYRATQATDQAAPASRTY